MSIEPASIWASFISTSAPGGNATDGPKSAQFHKLGYPPTRLIRSVTFNYRSLRSGEGRATVVLHGR